MNDSQFEGSGRLWGTVPWQLVFGVLALVAVGPRHANGQEMTESQQLLHDARSALGAGPGVTSREAGNQVVQARYEAAAAELSPPSSNVAAQGLAKPLPPRPAAQRDAGKSGEGDQKSPFAAPSATTLAGSTCVVLSLFFAVAWLLKRASPKSMQNLPAAAVEVLGRAPLVRGQHLQLVRYGQRLLLLAISANSAQTLAEVSDPQEVESLLAACRGNGSRFATHLENPRIAQDRQADNVDRVGELLSSVTGDKRPALSGVGRHV